MQTTRAEAEAEEDLETTHPVAVKSPFADAMHGRRKMMATAGMAGVAAGVRAERAEAAGTKEWKPVDLPIDPEIKPKTILFDIEFDNKNPKKGWLIGNAGTFFTTNDGGKTWEAGTPGRLGNKKKTTYTFTSISFKDGEGFLIGRPTILLHTTDTGATWQRVPLSPKLPGSPNSVVALGNGKAELSTDAGAIYVTENAGRNWTASVQEPIDATLNRVSSSGVSGASFYTGKIISIQRDENGARLAVSSRGNFYLTWSPGDESWIPHNRGVRRTVVAMGLLGKKIEQGIWLATAAGEIWKTEPDINIQAQDIEFKELKINSGGYSLLDVDFLPNGEAWAVGGSGKIFQSKNGGDSWKPDKVANNLPGNLYNVKFFGDDGYILGSAGILLKY